MRIRIDLLRSNIVIWFDGPHDRYVEFFTFAWSRAEGFHRNRPIRF
jgi:hypothetical protein